MQVTPLSGIQTYSPIWQPTALPSQGSAWAGPLAAYDAYTSFTPSAPTSSWPLYGPSGTLTGNSPPPSTTPAQPPGSAPSGLWGGAPAWLQDLMFFAYNPIGALLAPQAPLLATTPSSLGLGLNPNNGWALADIASSYNYDNLAASSATPSYLLDNGSVVTAQGVDLLA